MSGICGIVRFDDKLTIEEEISSMLNHMPNSGSDKKGILVDDSIGFGHKMLWTTPESLYENQPMKNIDNLIYLTADIRIDNRDVLINELSMKTLNQDIITDADIVLASYEKWGEACPEYLVGDFSFAIWDKKVQKLFCARDRIGVKPFYYMLGDDFFIFSSEISALLFYETVKHEPDLESIYDYSLYLTIRKDRTFFKNIKRLPSSSCLSVSSNKIEKIRRYWFPEHIPINKKITYEEALLGFKQHLEDAVSSCMRSAFPISIETSGGLDSSTVFCIASTQSTEVVPFTLHYNGLECDEIKYIEYLEKYSNKKILKLDVTKIDYKTKYGLDFLYHKRLDWPQGGTSIDHLYAEQLLEKKNVRIILTGVGGDEVLSSGYGYFRDFAKEGKWRIILREFFCLKIPLKRKIVLLIHLAIPKKIKLILNRFRKKTIDELKHPILNDIKLPSGSILTELNDIDNEIILATEYMQMNKDAVLSNQMAYWADSNLTSKAGRSNIEYRHPYFDTRLIEFLYSLPPEYRSRCGVYKGILRDAMKDVVPKIILSRKDKAEFSSSFYRQMKQMDVNSMNLFTYLNNKVSISGEDLIKTCYNHKENPSYIVYCWAIINLGVWYEKNWK